eukprot:GHVR01151746.1.p1 GENE.GHVR01151746.1~~GHVR01151746.1.p1  ORF type:complete len:225 (+),score=44.21 GHVR01151746.1:45-677(+)
MSGSPSDLIVVHKDIPPIRRDVLTGRVLNKYSEVDLLKYINEYICELFWSIPDKYPEARLIPFTRIAVNFIAVMFGFIGQFAFRFPQQSFYIILTVMAFTFFAVLVSWMDFFLIKESTFFLKDNNRTLSFDVFIPRWSGELNFRCRDMTGVDWLGGCPPTHTLTHTNCVSKFFDVDGYLSHHAVFVEVTRQMESFMKGQRDATQEKKKIK